MSAVIALILCGMVAEGAVLLVFHSRTGRGPAPRALLPNLAAGGMLLLAMLLSFQGFGPPAIGACLFGGLVAHIVDLTGRWRN